MKFYFIMGAIFSKLFNNPSKHFSITIAWVLMLLAMFFSSTLGLLFKMIPELMFEWFEAGTYESFPLYLVLISYTLLLFAVVSLISVTAFEMAFFVRKKFNVRIIQW